MRSTPTHPAHADDEDRLFHEGLRLFNAGEWFEAHEVWEDIWHMASGQKKRFYQGLIQYAVTIEHIRRGNPRGVKCVYETCLTKFRGLPTVYMGVQRTPAAECVKAAGPAGVGDGPTRVRPCDRPGPGHARRPDECAQDRAGL